MLIHLSPRKNGFKYPALLIDSGASAREARPRSTMGKKNGNSSSRENLVMTSAYERSNAVRTDSGGGGGASRGKPHGGSKEVSSFGSWLVYDDLTDVINHSNQGEI